MRAKICTRRRLWNESCELSGKLRKPDVVRRKWNFDRKHKRQLYHIVPLKKHNLGKRAMAANPQLSLWRRSIAAARTRLGIKGFVLIKKGTALYRLAKSIYNQGGPAAKRVSARKSKGRLPAALSSDYEVSMPVKKARRSSNNKNKMPALVLDIIPRRSGRSTQNVLPKRYRYGAE